MSTTLLGGSLGVEVFTDAGDKALHYFCYHAIFNLGYFILKTPHLKYEAQVSQVLLQQ